MDDLHGVRVSGVLYISKTTVNIELLQSENAIWILFDHCFIVFLKKKY